MNQANVPEQPPRCGDKFEHEGQTLLCQLGKGHVGSHESAALDSARRAGEPPQTSKRVEQIIDHFHLHWNLNQDEKSYLYDVLTTAIIEAATRPDNAGEPPQGEHMESMEEIAKLANFLSEYLPHEISRSENAVDIAIRLLRRAGEQAAPGLQALTKLRDEWLDYIHEMDAGALKLAPTGRELATLAADMTRRHHAELCAAIFEARAALTAPVKDAPTLRELVDKLAWSLGDYMKLASDNELVQFGIFANAKDALSEAAKLAAK